MLKSFDDKRVQEGSDPVRDDQKYDQRWIYIEERVPSNICGPTLTKVIKYYKKL